MDEKLMNITSTLDELLSKTNISKVTEDNRDDRMDLPEGFYLTEVKAAVLGNKKDTDIPMVTLTMTVVEDGLMHDFEREEQVGNTVLVPANGTKDTNIRLFYKLEDEKTVKRFVSDMLKFRNPMEPTQPLLDASYFSNTEILIQALELLASINLRIYIQASTSEKNGVKSTFYNLVKWDTAKDLGLPVE